MAAFLIVVAPQTRLACGQAVPFGRAAFLKQIDRARVALSPEVRELSRDDAFVKLHFEFASEAGQRVPGLLLKSPQPVRRPAVIVLHGTGGAKEGQLNLLKELASRGFVSVAIDGRYHGERTRAGRGAGEYVEAILRAYRSGREYPFLYDTVWDVMRLVDYLETRDDVDARRIGLIGFSKGGMETTLAAAADPRIVAAVPCIGVQSFRWALDNDAWSSRIGTFQAAVNAAAADANVTVDAAFVRRFYDRVVPGIYDRFDGPAMLPSVAPRPLLVINGDSDPRTPLPGVHLCADAARKAYAAAGAEDRFALRVQKNTGHAVTPEARREAVEWLVRWLLNEEEKK